MVDRARVDQLLVLLTRYIRILRDLGSIPVEEYISDPRNFGSGERFLQLAIETSLSIGHHVIAASGFDQPGSYAEVFRVLGRAQVLDPEFASSLEPMARMRNRLVHHYEDVDASLVRELIRTRLSDFDTFAEQVTRYLDSVDNES